MVGGRRCWLTALAVMGGCGRAGFDPVAADAAADAGVAWTLEPSGTTAKLYAVSGTGDADVYAIGAGVILRSPGDGTWAPVFTLGNALFALWSEPAGEVVAVGNVLDGEAVILRGRGAAWTREPSGIARPLNGVWGAARTDLYAVGHDGNILHSAGDGTWTPQVSGTTERLVGVSGASATDIYAVGDGGTILHSAGGGTWTAEVSGTEANLISVWAASPTSIYAVGYGGVVLHRGGDGRWTPEPSGTGDNLYDVWGTTPTDIYAVGLDGHVHRSAGDGAWGIETTLTTGSQLDGIWTSPGGDVYIIGDVGVIARRISPR